MGQRESLCSLLKPLGGGLANASLKRAHCNTYYSLLAFFLLLLRFLQVGTRKNIKKGSCFFVKKTGTPCVSRGDSWQSQGNQSFFFQMAVGF